MSTRKMLTAGALVAAVASVAVIPRALADPLTPLTSGENQFLEQARHVYSVVHNPIGFRSDGELLADGRYACDKRDAGFEGVAVTFIDPVLNQLAFIYLCP